MIVSTEVEDSKVEVKLLGVLTADDDGVSEAVELLAMDEDGVNDAIVEKRVTELAVPITVDSEV